MINNAVNLIKNIIIEARPAQWIKNLALFTGLLFSEKLFEINYFLTISKAFGIFCLLTSATYYFNDLRDQTHDQTHPTKSKRPISSGALNKSIAIIVMLSLGLTGLILAYMLSTYFFALCLLYTVLTTLYSAFLKDIALIESVIVALGFVIRVLAGAVVINVSISSWLTLCTISLALLISFGRRKSEITLLGFEKASKHRAVLAKYPKQFLEVMISSLIASTFISYMMFTFTYSQGSGLYSVDDVVYLPSTLQTPKWMMLTIPMVFYSISRYTYLVYNRKSGGAPEQLVIKDLPMLLSIVSWFLAVVLIIYFPSGII